MSEWNRKIIEEFRANEGKVGGRFEGTPMLILHSKGAKTGREHLTPLMYRPNDDGMIIFGSKAGDTKDPDWVWNLRANPEVTVEVGAETLRARATFAEGETYDRIWSAHKIDYPIFAEYEKRAQGRKIPIIVLEPVSGT